MKNSILIATCAAAIALPTTLSAQEVLDRASDAVQNTAESAARSAEQAVDRTIQEAENTGRRAANVLDNAVENTRIEAENRIDATIDEGRQELRSMNNDAQLRNETQWQNRDAPQLDSQLDNRYRSGYRGDMPSTHASQSGWNQGATQATAMHGNVTDGRVYVLRYDRWGREFICVNGQAVYFDNQGSSVAQQSFDSDRYRAGYGSYDAQSDRTETSSRTRFDAPGAAPVPGESSDPQNRIENEGDIDLQQDADRTNLDAEARLDESGAEASLDARDRDSQERPSLDAEIDASGNIDEDVDISADSEINADANLDSNAGEDLNLQSDADVDIDTEL